MLDLLDIAVLFLYSEAPLPVRLWLGTSGENASLSCLEDSLRACLLSFNFWVLLVGLVLFVDRLLRSLLLIRDILRNESLVDLDLIVWFRGNTIWDSLIDFVL
jgi:hypothetical protein